MEDQILKLIYDYSKNNRIIDKKYIDNVINIMVNFLDVNNYVSKLNFKNSEENENNKLNIKINNKSDFKLLGYNFISQEINCYKDKISEMYQYFNNLNLDTDKNLYSKTTLCTQSILHELYHVDQKRKIKEENDTESKILDLAVGLSDKEFLLEMNNNELNNDNEKAKKLSLLMIRMMLYMENYKYDPHERMAEIDSYKLIKKIISSINLPDTNEYIEDKLLKNLIGAYQGDGAFSPTIKFISEMDKLYKRDSLTTFDWYDIDKEICLNKSISQYSFEQRIRYGLPIEENPKLKLLKKLSASKYGIF